MARPCSFMEITPAIIGNHSSDIRSTHGQTDRHKDTTRLVRFRTQPDSTTRLDHRYIWTQPDRSGQLDMSGHNLTDQPNLSTGTSVHNLTDQPNSRTVTSSTENDLFEPHARGNNAVNRPLYHHRHRPSLLPV